MNPQEHLEVLGYLAEDKVTTFRGIAVSVAFDLYGCIQILLNPGLDKDLKFRDSVWFDISRIRILHNNGRLMTPPDYTAGTQAEGKHGAAEKPPADKP